MTIAIPEFLEEKLGDPDSRKLRGAVYGTVALFDEWLKDSKLPFFPDYTDHGPKHLSKVLHTAVGLMTDESRELCSPADAAVLILSVLLHDSAMHLSPAGFEALVRGSWSKNKIKEFDATDWTQLWDDYLFSAKRWDDRKLGEVLGAQDGKPIAAVRDPFKDYKNLTEADCRLIGEFIRRHHPRMAHEFAVYGVPGPTSNPIRPAEEFGNERCDLAGLIARSHGLPVRGCLDYLTTGKYQLREPDGVRAVYLMTLLRVADYLQIERDRSSGVIFRYKHIPSKTSELEHRVHDAVRHITPTHEDPESVEVQASPKDVLTYLRLKEWLSGIQGELDASWAVLGEVYGRYQPLSRLGLVIRRVRSTLDNEDAFRALVDYVPQRVEFEVARPDLLKLLIKPLYGDRPEIGIRELMQNGVDAVLEREEFVRRHPEYALVPLAEQEGDVEIWLEDLDDDGHAWLTVSDKGIGMTEETICGYFLKAGASYRCSDEWKREFENESEEMGVESRTKARVLRSGRFGVGALAAFLLGPELHIQTRYVTSDTGLKFQTTLDGGPIEMRRTAGLRVGTVVRVRVPADVHERLVEGGRDESSGEIGLALWDWYCVTQPRVTRRWRQRPLPPRYTSPNCDSELPPAWRRLRYPHVKDVHWTCFSGVSGLACNGIHVRRPDNERYSEAYPDELQELHDGWSIQTPRLSVFDPDGVFPLNLQRDRLSAPEFPFQTELVRDMLRDFLAYLLVSAPEPSKVGTFVCSFDYPGIQHNPRTWADLAIQLVSFTPLGVGLAHEAFMSRHVMQRVLLLAGPRTKGRKPEVQGDMRAYDGVFACFFGPSNQYRHSFVGRLHSALSRSGRLPGSLGRSFQLLGARFFTTWRVAQDLRKLKYLPETVKLALTDEWHSKRWAIFKIGDCRESHLIDSLRKPTLEIPGEGSEAMLAVELFVSAASGASVEGNALVQLWTEIIREPIIPFDLGERRSTLKHAYDVLAPYIEAHEAMLEKDELEEGE